MPSPPVYTKQQSESDAKSGLIPIYDPNANNILNADKNVGNIPQQKPDRVAAGEPSFSDHVRNVVIPFDAGVLNAVGEGLHALKQVHSDIGDLGVKAGFIDPGHEQNIQQGEMDALAKYDQGANLGYNQDFINNSSAASVGKMIPMLLGGESQGAKIMGLQAVGNMSRTVDNLKAQGVKFDNGTDRLMIYGSGLISYALGKSVTGTILSKVGGQPLVNEVTASLAADATRSLADLPANATADDISQYYSQQALAKTLSFSQKFGQVGLGYLKAYPNIALDFAGANLARSALKAGVNALNNKAPFPGVTGDEIVKDISSPVYNDSTPANGSLGQFALNMINTPAAGFSLLHAASTDGMLYDKSPYLNPVVDVLQKDGSPQTVQAIKVQLGNIGKQKGWSATDILHTQGKVDEIADVVNSIPKGLQPNKFNAAVSLILGRRQLEGVQEGIANNESGIDPAMQPKVEGLKNLVTAKIEQANDQLTELATDKSFRYFEKEGKFWKQQNGEEPIEITKDRADLEDYEKEQEKKRAAQIAAPAESVQPNPPAPVAASPAVDASQLDDLDNELDAFKQQQAPAQTNAEKLDEVVAANPDRIIKATIPKNEQAKTNTEISAQQPADETAGAGKAIAPVNKTVENKPVVAETETTDVNKFLSPDQSIEPIKKGTAKIFDQHVDKDGNNIALITAKSQTGQDIATIRQIDKNGQLQLDARESGWKVPFRAKEYFYTLTNKEEPTNAISEQSTGKVGIRESSAMGEGLGSENRSEVPAGESAAKNEAGQVQGNDQKVAENPYYVSMGTAEKPEYVQVEGEPLNLKNNYKLDVFTHKLHGTDGYGVTEGSTGLSLGKGKTKEDAIEAYKRNLSKLTPAELQAKIDQSYESGLKSPRGTIKPEGENTDTENTEAVIAKATVTVGKAKATTRGSAKSAGVINEIDASIDEVDKELANAGLPQPSKESPSVITLGKDRTPYTHVGTNAAGKDLYENEHGVRAKDEGNGIFSQEKVNIIPTRQGVTVGLQPREDDFKTTDEKAPEPEQPKEEPKSEKQSKRAQYEDELKKAKKAFMDTFNKAMSGINPETIEKGIKLLAIYAKIGIHDFGEIVKDLYEDLGEKAGEVFDGLKAAYGAFATSADATDEEIEAMTNLKEVRKAKFEDYITKKENGTDNERQRVEGNTPSIPAGQLPGKAANAVPGKQTEEVPGRPDNNSGENGNADHGKQTVPEVRPGGSDDNGSPAGTGSGPDRQGGRSKNAGSGVPKNTEKRSLKPEDQNHYIRQDDEIGEGSPIEKFNKNMDAIFLLKKLESEDRNPSPEEKKVLAQFVGWGGLAEYLKGGEYSNEQAVNAAIAGKREVVRLNRWDNKILDFSKDGPINAPSYSSFSELANEIKNKLNNSGYPIGIDEVRKSLVSSLFTNDELNAAKNSTINANYTERQVINKMWELAKQLGFKGGNTLETSAGIGNFFGLMPKDLRDSTKLTGYELDSITGRMLKKLYPEAKITVSGFEKSNVQPNSQDLVIGNVPFAQKAPFDKNYPDISKFNMHNYFIGKSMRLLKPGGVAMVITSKSTLDGDPKFREWMSSPDGGNSVLVGAVRLPNNAFSENAGTQVTTDIVVFRKRDNNKINPLENEFRYTYPIEEKHFDKEGNQVPINVNEYYHQHPENMLGKMMTADEAGSGGLYGGKDATLHAPSGYNVISNLNKAIKSFPSDIMQQEQSAQVEKPVEETVEAIDKKEGSMFEKGGKIYMVRDGEGVAKYNEKPAEVKIAKAYIALKTTLLELIKQELSPVNAEANIEALRKELNKEYDAFVEKNKALHKNRAIKFLEDDVDYPLVQSLEEAKDKFVDDGKGGGKKVTEIKKSALFKKRINFPRTEPDAAENIKDAINISFNYRNGLDLNYISKLLGQPVADVKNTLINENLAFENPNTGLLESPEEYLSGYVRDKLDQAKAAVETDEKFNRNVAELEKVIPKDIPASLIQYSLGSTWVPPAIYEDFVKSLLGVDSTIKYKEALAKWDIASSYGLHDSRNRTTYAGGGVDGVRLLENALNNIQTTVSMPKADGGGIDAHATEEARERQAQIEDEFVTFMRSNKEAQDITEPIYNKIYNNFVERNWQTPNIDYYPGQSKTISLYDEQKRSVARGLAESTLGAQEVGFGKSFVQHILAMEAKRLGLAKKTMVVVQKATLGQYVTSFRRMYPTAKILAPSEADFSAENRAKLYAKISTQDWDAIIMPHSQFDMIPDKPERRKAYIQEKIDNLQKSIDEADNGADKKAIESKLRDLDHEMRLVDDPDALKMNAKGEYIEKKGKNVKNEAKKALSTEAKMERLLNRHTDRSALHFEDMGIDNLILDECFPYETPVLTTKGWLPIGLIVEQKLDLQVLSYNVLSGTYETKRITNWLRKPIVNKMLKVRHKYGTFVCTSNHHILTENGYIRAKDLTNNDRIIFTTLQVVSESPGQKGEVCILQHEMCVSIQSNPSHTGQSNREKSESNADMRMVQNKSSKSTVEKILFGTLCSEVSEQFATYSRAKETSRNLVGEKVFGDTKSKFVSQNEIKQSNEQPEICSKNESQYAGENIFVKGRQWDFNPAANYPMQSIGIAGGQYGVGDSDEACMGTIPIVAKSLQGGYWYARSDDSYRGRRENTQVEEMEVFGQAENGNFECVRVEGIEVYERASDAGFGFSNSPSDRVYDLTVADNHNYFAAGILVSNCHAYKKLGLTTSLQNIKGIDQTASKRAQSLYLKTRHIQEKTGGKNVNFFTGTPITNTMAEVWTWMRFIRPELVERLGITHFDQFVNTFGVIANDIEFNATGSFKNVNRFRSFKNAPELLTAFRSIAHVVLKDDVKEITDSGSVPKLLNGEKTKNIIPLTPPVKEILDSIVRQLKAWGNLSSQEKRLGRNRSIPVVLYGHAKVASIDPRMYNPEAQDHPDSKVNNLIKVIVKKHADTKAIKGTQMIFSDRQNSMTGERQYLDENEEFLNPAYGKKQFHLFEDMKKKLIAAGIPENEIAIATDPKYDKQERKQALFEAVNEGLVRVVFGSTEKMGVGVNAQKHLVAEHHLDVPNRPSDMVQREGRILRPGNENKIVEVSNNGMEGTADAMAYNVLMNKEKFIKQLMTTGTVERVIDDAAGEDVPTFDEMMARLSGSKYAIEKIKTDANIKREKTKKDIFFGRVIQAKRDLQSAQSNLNRNKAALNKDEFNAAKVEKSFPDGEILKVEVSGQPEATEKFPAAVDGYLDRLNKKYEESPTKYSTGEIKINGVPVQLSLHEGLGGSVLEYTILDLGIKDPYYTGKGIAVPSGKGVGLLSSLRSKLEDVIEKPGKTKALISQNTNNIEQLGHDIDQKFDDTHLKELEVRSETLKGLMIEEGVEKEKSENERLPAIDEILDQSNVKPILDAMDKLKAKPGGQMMGLLVPIPPAVWNGAIDILKNVVKATNSTQKAVRIAVKYIIDRGGDTAQASDFEQSINEMLAKTTIPQRHTAPDTNDTDTEANLVKAAIELQSKIKASSPDEKTFAKLPLIGLSKKQLHKYIEVAAVMAADPDGVLSSDLSGAIPPPKPPVTPPVTTGGEDGEPNRRIPKKEKIPMELIDAPESESPDEPDGVKKNYSLWGKLKDVHVRNLEQLKFYGKDMTDMTAFRAMLHFAASKSEANVNIKLSNDKINKLIGEDGYKVLREALMESRLRGTRERWQNFARDIRAMDDTELSDLFDAGKSSAVYSIIKDLEGYDDDENPAQSILALLDNQEYDDARDYLGQMFDNAADNVSFFGKLSNGKTFDEMTQPDGTGNLSFVNPKYQESLQQYKQLIEKPFRESHVTNEGIFSDALGPLDTYYPLSPVGKDAHKVVMPAKTKYNEPANINNHFTKGSADLYSSEISALAKKLSASFKTNNKAAAIRALYDAGLVAHVSGDSSDKYISINGVTYEATKVPVADARTIITNNQIIHTPTRYVLVPNWLYQEIKPIIEGDISDHDHYTAFGHILNATVNFMLGGPAEAVGHSYRLLSGIINSMPYMQEWAYQNGILGHAAGLVLNNPIVKIFGAMGKVLFTSPSSDEFAQDVQQMAAMGLIPEKTWTHTYSHEFAKSMGVEPTQFPLPWKDLLAGNFKKVFNKGKFLDFSPLLYGKNGIDLKARVTMFRLVRAMNPNATPEQYVKMLADMGQYTSSLQGKLEKFIKENGIAPFATFSRAYYRAGLKNLLMMTQMPIDNPFSKGGGGFDDPGKAGKFIYYKLAQIMTGGILGLIGYWMLIHKEVTGKWPSDDPHAKLLKVPIPEEWKKDAFIKKFYYNKRTNSWDDFSIGFTNIVADRGLKAVGAYKGYETAKLGGNIGQVIESSEIQAVNTYLSQYTASPLVSIPFTGTTGDAPYLSRIHNFRGQVEPSFLRKSKTAPAGLQMPENLAQGLFGINPMFEMANPISGSLDDDYNQKDYESGRFLKSILNIAAPQLMSPHGNDAKKAKSIKANANAIETTIKKEHENK